MTVPTPVAPVGIQNLGPGQLTIGETGSPIDASSLVNGITLVPSTQSADATTKLSGWVRGGSSSTTWALSGNADTDAGNVAGLWQLAFDLNGAETDFVYVPQFGGPTVTGRLKLTPMPLGADEFGADLVADFEWQIVGVPTLTRTEAGG